MSCQKWIDAKVRDPEHWMVNLNGLQKYMKCLCEEKQPSVVCQSLHPDEVRAAAMQIADSMSQLPVPGHRRTTPEGVKDQLQIAQERGVQLASEHANSSWITLGPCDIPFECTICAWNKCKSIPFPKTSKNPTGKDSLAEVEVTYLAKLGKPGKFSKFLWMMNLVGKISKMSESLNL